MISRWIKIIYLRGARQLGGRGESARATSRPGPVRGLRPRPSPVDTRPVMVTAQLKNFEIAMATPQFDSLGHDLAYFSVIAQFLRRVSGKFSGGV